LPGGILPGAPHVHVPRRGFVFFIGAQWRLCVGELMSLAGLCPRPRFAFRTNREQATSVRILKWSFLKASGVAIRSWAWVTRLTPDADILSSEVVLQIRLNDSSRLSLVLRWIPCEPSLLGALVFISAKTSAAAPDLRRDSIPQCHRITRDQNGWTRCPTCKAWISTATFDNHESRCAIHYKA